MAIAKMQQRYEKGRCLDRAAEGSLQGGLSGAVFGSFVALNARLRRPAPKGQVVRQITRLIGGHALAIGSVFAIFNGGTAYAHYLRHGQQEDDLLNSTIGGFVSGFLIAIPFNLKPPSTTNARPLFSSAYSSPLSTTSSLLSLARRVSWGRCSAFGIALASVGAGMQLMTQSTRLRMHAVASAPPSRAAMIQMEELRLQEESLAAAAAAQQQISAPSFSVAAKPVQAPVEAEPQGVAGEIISTGGMCTKAYLNLMSIA